MINKILLNDLIKTQDLKILEQHIIYTYLLKNNFDFRKSLILSKYFEDFHIIPKLFFDINLFNITSIKELENYLELIIPIKDRKLNGAFFTPDYIVDFIINEIKPKYDDTNLDPSCGCGAFLIGLVDYYKNTFNKKIKDIVKQNVFGADILNYNVERTKLLLTIYGLQYDEILIEDDFNLYNHDSLKTDFNLTFNNIIGNPPYVKFQDLTEINRNFLSKNWTTIENGSFNLYFAFFELGYKLLNKNGKLGYITPNNYFTSLAGESLRKFFQQKKMCFKNNRFYS